MCESVCLLSPVNFINQVEKSGKVSCMQSFKDLSLRDGKFLIDLIDSIQPGSIDYSLVMHGNTGL